ncbi:MAG: redox-regulated ATPase YchF [Chloroflexota bacterium]|nr:redox-regulated ATPase YchF [Chloroflexota bacterium]
MKLGIIGLPNSGKTTIFNALTRGDLPTGAATSGQFEMHTATVAVPDPRIEKMKAMYKPKKLTYAQVTYVDIGGLDKGIGEGGLSGQFRNQLSQLDGFLHVVRVFQDDNVPHPYDTIDASRDVNTLDSEFLLTDLVAIEARLEKLEVDLKRKGKTGDKALSDEKELLLRLKEHLESDRPLRDMGLTDDEIKPLRGYGFLTLKPVLIVLNADDSSKDATLTYDHQLSSVVVLQGRIEGELSQLDAEDAEIFMAEYGITELSAARVIHVSYELMNIQTFLTVGEDEVRAWSVRIGATAPEAAGVIHSDLQKGFIRAEVMAYDDLVAGGSEAALKATGKFRLEGKEYIVKDGDIVHIRFNV